ncbi:MAG: response regulator [Trueperaceae bacterium]|nr:response regulator [Truepera sp.]HRN18150.1 response regulator [Trueperaceae bacterium]HRQ10685.1 response regulator [Trueperaceae bacterium]
MSQAKEPTIVLVADDIEGQRRVLEMLLSVDGYEVVTVDDGKEALEYLKENTPDIAILDVKMPHLSGIEVCDRMKRTPRLRDVPVIVLTALRDDHTLGQARLALADRIIYKPLEGKDFRATVRELLASGSAEPLP